MTEIQRLAKGRWPTLLETLGVEKKFLTGRHTSCPLCGGSDRFRFTDRGGEGMYYCNQCGGGDGFRLIENLKGLPFREVVQQVKAIVGDAPVSRAKPKASKEEIRAKLRKLWRETTPLRSGHCAWSYLRGRGISESILSRTQGLRQGDGMMVAVVSDSQKRPATMHKTLIKNGQKTGAMNMPGSIPDGAAIQLIEAQDCLGIAEGIETALSAAQMFDIPVWSALSADMMMKWRPPQEVSSVVIFGDNDRSYTGHAAAYTLAKRLTSFGVSVEVKFPDIPACAQKSWDWNDELKERAKADCVA